MSDMDQKNSFQLLIKDEKKETHPKVSLHESLNLPYNLYYQNLNPVFISYSFLPIVEYGSVGIIAVIAVILLDLTKRVGLDSG